ncbi:MAG: hypothetical protein KF901_22375 [Myxococcales bacterium]|nr:hypothetical protein [Myxococcales bacterium]
MRRVALGFVVAGALLPSVVLGQTYGPYTFSGPSSWATSAVEVGGACAGGSAYPGGVCTTNVVGHSPTVCVANMNSGSSVPVGSVCSTTQFMELRFDGVPITNVVGPDVIVFDSRFSVDGLAVSVEVEPDTFSPFLVWGGDEQFVLAPGSGCAGATLAAAPVDLARFGLPPGFVTRRIRVASANAGSACQADLTMAGVPDGGVVCSVDADCNDGNPCTEDECIAGGICRSTWIAGPGCGLPNGSPCSADADCVSDACTDGVCCNVDCAGQCEACDVEGSVGTCTAVTGAPRGGRAACATDGTLCGGSCDGATRDACAYPGAATMCRAGQCIEGVATAQASCNGAGSCPPEMTVECTPYLCGAEMCAGECATDADCALEAFCAGGMCLPKLPNGDPCDRARQCGSELCVDGFCCGSVCDGQCEACDVLGDEGTCTPVIGAPHGARPACASDGTACGGACDGADTEGCAYPTAATPCGEAGCTAGQATPAGSCDGAGSCDEGESVSCAPFVCGPTACLDTCEGDADCVAGRVCIGGACVLPEADAGVPDAGVLDAGVPDAGMPDAGAPDADLGGGYYSGSCGCTTPGSSRGFPTPALLLGLLSLAAVLRRRLG